MCMQKYRSTAPMQDRTRYRTLNLLRGTYLVYCVSSERMFLAFADTPLSICIFEFSSHHRPLMQHWAQLDLQPRLLGCIVRLLLLRFRDCYSREVMLASQFTASIQGSVRVRWKRLLNCVQDRYLDAIPAPYTSLKVRFHNILFTPVRFLAWLMQAKATAGLRRCFLAVDYTGRDYSLRSLQYYLIGLWIYSVAFHERAQVCAFLVQWSMLPAWNWTEREDVRQAIA